VQGQSIGSEPLSPRGGGAPRIRILGVFIFLTIVVWGLFAFDRGFWQDDTIILATVHERPRISRRFFGPMVSPTRRLAGTPFALALKTGSPLDMLQLVYGATWLAGGLLTYAILLRLFPREKWLAFVAGCLTLTATGDFLTDSLVALHYEIAAAAYFASLAALVSYLKSGRRAWLVAAAAALSVSVWTTDASFAAIVLTPAFLWVTEGRRVTHRLRVATIVMIAVFLPYLAVFAKFFTNPRGYAAHALTRMNLLARGELIGRLFLHNFNPWAWGPARANWFASVGPVISQGLRVALAATACLAFLSVALVLWRDRRARGEGGDPTSSVPALTAMALLMALASNGAYAFVQDSQFFYRTQIVSRYWSSIALALLAFSIGRLAARRPWFALAIPAGFVALGSYGGLDRQDYFLAYWRRHRLELSSILRVAPSLAPDSVLVLRVPAGPPYLASAAQYLAKSWTSLLYDDPSMTGRTILWSPSRGTTCRIEGERLDCRGVELDGIRSVPLQKTVLLTYDTSTNRFALAEALPADIPGTGPAAGAAYAPKARIAESSPTALATKLLKPPRLSRLLERSATPP